MNGILGTYRSSTPGVSKLVIQSANESDGKMSGTITVNPAVHGIGETTVPFTGQFSLQPSLGPGCTFWLGGGIDSISLFSAFAGTATMKEKQFNSLLISGSLAIAGYPKGSTFPFSGVFNRE